jgi:hypothetical protein
MSNAEFECEELLSAVVPFAEQMLIKNREFFPFGTTLASDGQLAHAAGWTGEEQPSSAELIALLQSGFQKGASNGDYKATALVFDVRTMPPGKEVKQDAIAVALDHRDAYSIVVYFPYFFASTGELNIENPFAV